MPGRRTGEESGGSLGPLAGPRSRGLPGADSGWGWGLGLVAAGAEVPRGRGRALLEQDRLRFPRHRLTHSLAAAQAGGIAPKEVAARDSAAGRAPSPPPPGPHCSLRASIRGGSEREPPGLHTGVRARAAGGICADSGHCTYVQERLCVRGGRLSVSLLGCTCVAEQQRGEVWGTPGSLACR